MEERDYEASLFQAQAQNTQRESVPAMNEKSGGHNIRNKSNIMCAWLFHFSGAECETDEPHSFRGSLGCMTDIYIPFALSVVLEKNLVPI